MREVQNDYSLVLLKPECSQCDGIREQFVAIAGESVIMSRALTLDKNSARMLWEKSVNHYAWAECYYEAMSGQVHIYILDGRETGKRVKIEFRNKMRDLIAQLTEKCGKGFSLDLIHASDPGNEHRELAILGMGSQSCVSIWQLEQK